MSAVCSAGVAEALSDIFAVLTVQMPLAWSERATLVKLKTVELEPGVVMLTGTDSHTGRERFALSLQTITASARSLSCYVTRQLRRSATTWCMTTRTTAR